MTTYRTPYGLPVRYKAESGTHIENEFLFGVYELLFTEKTPPKVLEDYFFLAQTNGFPNHVNPSVPQKKLSHDQVTAYLCFSFLSNNKGFLGVIPGPEDFHPRDFMFYALLKKKWYGFLLLPLFYLTCLISFASSHRVTYDPVTRPDEVFRLGNFIVRSKLSGELLWLLRYETMHCDLLLAILAYPLKPIIKTGALVRFGGVKEMVFAYFQNQEEHPIVKNWNYKL